MLSMLDSDEQGVSPVIGVIIMVAVTVALAALAANFVFNVGGQSSEQATITLDGETNSSGGVSFTVIKNQNVDSLSFRSGGSEQASISSPSAGDTASITSGSISNGEIVVVATVNGNDQVIQTYEV